MHAAQLPRPIAHERRFNGAKMRQLRKARGFKLVDLAFYVGVASQTVHRWESGRTEKPRYEYVRTIADVLGVSVDDLYEVVVREDA